MRQDSTLGIIGGNGWLGHALARAALAAGGWHPSQLMLSCRSDRRGPVDLPGVRWTRDNQELVDGSQLIVIAVRPEQFPAVRIDARGKLVISVMAGVPVETLAKAAQAERIVRAMPNAAATIGRSYTPWFASPAVLPSDKSQVQALFESCGTAEDVPREADIDYMTGLTGSGPAFPALLADAMISHAVARGLRPELARRAVLGVVVGASQLLADDAHDPAALIRTFIGYRGTTAAALQAMIDGGFATSVAAGLNAADARAAEMARSSIEVASQ
jgi:pyrroline-5-carboxylate reductase